MLNFKIVFLLILYYIIINYFISIAYTQIYKYRNSNGDLYYTDTISDISEDQYDIINQLPEIRFIDSKSHLKKNDKSNNLFSKDTITQNKLFIIRQNLSKEYSKLIREKEAIEKEMYNGLNKEILTKRAEQLNKSIRAYEKNRNSFQQAINKYYESLKYQLKE